MLDDDSLSSNGSRDENDSVLKLINHIVLSMSKPII